jgi:hypothetical protein
LRLELELKPETERLVQDELRQGRVHSLDELIVEGVFALREKSAAAQPTVALKPRKKLYDLLTQPPFAGSDLNLERAKDYPRPIDP